MEELEVSLFGPGVGESIALHLPGGEWLVVDSCLDRTTGRSAARSYLERLGVTLDNVKLIVATHIHDDHLRGIADLFADAPAARFVLPQAIGPREFANLISFDEGLAAAATGRTNSEIAAIGREVVKRIESGSPASPVARAVEGRVLLESEEYEVRALSPSDEAVTLAMQKLHEAFTSEEQLKESAFIDPNELAIALWVQAGNASILLGSDLTNGPERCGWSAVLATFAPAQKASLFKVPHHGSPTSQNDEVWSQLLDDGAVAVVAPYRAGRRPLPSETDQKFLGDRAGVVFQTAPTRTSPETEEDRRRLASIATLGSHVRLVSGDVGQVQLRCDPKEASPVWRAALRPPAYRAA
ncbi:MBL fold metallo-hydrolase [Jatrophihabitans sp. YIM 134969]